MSTPTINSVSVPAAIVTRGKWDFHEQRKVKRGDGIIIGVGPQSATWWFPNLKPDELSWWTVDLLGGAYSLSAAMSLWINNSRDNVYAFTSGIVYRPEFDEARFQYGRYWDVTVRFDLLLPLVAGIPIGQWTVGTSLVGSLDAIAHPL